MHEKAVKTNRPPEESGRSTMFLLVLLGVKWKQFDMQLQEGG